MSLAFNTGGRLELYTRKQAFFSDCSPTTSGCKLLYSLNVSGNKPFQRLQNRNLIPILYYVIVKEKNRFFKFAQWNCQLPQSMGNCKPTIYEKVNPEVVSVLTIMLSQLPGSKCFQAHGVGI